MIDEHAPAPDETPLDTAAEGVAAEAAGPASEPEAAPGPAPEAVPEPEPAMADDALQIVLQSRHSGRRCRRCRTGNRS